MELATVMASHAKAALFVMRMVHVWQSGHGKPTNLLRGTYLYVRYLGDYEYLQIQSRFIAQLSDFNLEQQAADHRGLILGVQDLPLGRTSGPGNCCPTTCPSGATEKAGPFSAARSPTPALGTQREQGSDLPPPW